MPRQNALDIRVDRLAEALKDRLGVTSQLLTEPKPYNQHRVSEEEQVRKYLQLRDSGQLPALRQELGDEQVNNYVRAMQGRAQKYLNILAERETTDGKEPSTADTQRETGEPVAQYYSADDDLEHF